MGMRGLYRPNAKLIWYSCNHSDYIGGGAVTIMWESDHKRETQCYRSRINKSGNIPQRYIHVAVVALEEQ